MRSCRSRFGAAFVLVALLAGASAFGQKPPVQQRPTYRSGVDMVPVDVIVLDDHGAQVADLTAEDFAVTIDGRPRRVLSSDYLGGPPTAGAAAGRAVLASGPARVSTNQGPRGRLVMLVVDQEGIGLGEVRAGMEGAKQLLSNLAPEDLAGLAVLPTPGVSVEFTRDKAQILDALERVIGLSSDPLAFLPGPFTTGYTNPGGRLGDADVLAFARRGYEWEMVLGRECPRLELGPLCQGHLEAEATGRLAEIHRRAAQFSAGMRGVLAYLRKLDAPTTLVLLSAGVVADPMQDDSTAIGAEAAAVRCSIYALRFGGVTIADASVRMPSPTLIADAGLARATLDTLAGQTRGRLFDVPGSTLAAFKRIGVELSGFYLLGVEPEEGDRDGRRHQIKVEVRRKNVSVRARRELMWKAPSPGPATPELAVRAMLASPVPVADVPLRVASYVAPGPDDARLRVLISAELDREHTLPEDVTIGWTLAAESGKAWEAAAQKLNLRVAGERSSGPLAFVLATPLLEPGPYTFRMAVVDAEGRMGSVAHPVDVRLRPAGGLAAGDLVIGPPPAGPKGDFEPPVECVIEGDRMLVYLPVAPARPQGLARLRATLQVSAPGSERPLLEAKIPVSGRKPGEQAVQATVSLGLLPPGSYVARVRLGSGEALFTAAREFSFAPARNASVGASVSGDAAHAPLLRPPFALSDVLAPEALAPFLDRAARAGTGLPASVFEDARAGRLAAAVSALPGEATGPVPPFLRGLALLERGDVDAAGAQFRDSRHSSPDFADAVVFLGVCFLAGGRDDEAVGALQTARFGLDGEPMVHHLLIDARLARRQIDQATALAERASKRWPDDARFRLQLAFALAAGGKGPRALELVEAYLVTRADDVNALFLALRLLYASATARGAKVDGDVVRRFRGYADRYAAAKGPDAPLVEEWLKHLAR